MKISKLHNGLALSAIVLALCASRSHAAIRSVTLGNLPGADINLNLSATTGVPGDPNNPNAFPIYFAEYTSLHYGFLLDGSEWSAALMKRFEDAHANNTNVTIFYDDSPAQDFEIMNTKVFPNTPSQVHKIVYITTY